MVIAINDVKIEKFTPSDEDINKYIEAQRNNTEVAFLTLNQYLKEKYFKNTNVIVTADLSDRIFSEVDLSGGDFTGCIFKNTSFQKCNLANSVFCDVDFDNAHFEETILKNIDFRGVDLANCPSVESSFINSKTILVFSSLLKIFTLFFFILPLKF